MPARVRSRRKGLPTTAEGGPATASAGGAAAAELLGASLARVLEDHAGRDSETSSQFGGRLPAMRQSLEQEAASDAAVVLAAKIEYYLRDLLKRFIRDPTADHSSPTGYVTWATKLIDGLAFCDMPDAVEGEAYLMALARISKADPQFVLRSLAGMRAHFSVRDGAAFLGGVGVPVPGSATPVSSPAQQCADAAGSPRPPVQGAGSDRNIEVLVNAFKESQRDLVDQLLNRGLGLGAASGRVGASEGAG